MYEMSKVDFFDKTLTNCEALDLSYKLFDNIDYSQDSNNVSFYRCDFRRSRFNKCIFFRNPFGRADFIDTYIINTKFFEVNWGSCLFQNAMFEQTEFRQNKYKGVSAKNSYFKKCTFFDENMILNMSNCTYEECTFNNCIFEKSSIDNITFINCKFIQTDISQCHAEKLKFQSCELESVYLGLPYWATYLFKDTFISSFGFKYRGKIIEIVREDYFRASFKEFMEKGRLYEYLNAHIISKQLSLQSNLYDITIRVFERLVEFPEKIRRKIILDIIEMLEFYFNYENIDFITYYQIINFIDNYGKENFPFNENIEYAAAIYKIKELMSNFEYDFKYLYTIDSTKKCEVVFHLGFSEKEKAILYLNTIFNSINKSLCNGYYKPPLFSVKSIDSGSIILTISSWALLAILVSYSAKKVCHNLESIKIKHTLSNVIQTQLVDNIQKQDGTDIDKIGRLAAKYQLLNTDDIDEERLNKISSEITKGEILSIILSMIA